MRKEGNKYILKESELTELIQKAIIMEAAYNPQDFRYNFPNGQVTSPPELKDIGRAAGQLLKGTAGALIPDAWKERIAQGDNQFLQWLLGSLNANAEGSAAPEFFPSPWDGKWAGGPGYNPKENPRNPDAHEQLSVSRACWWLRSNAHSRYNRFLCGRCAEHVRSALNYGGLSVPHDMYAGAAKDYLNILYRNGWDEISLAQAGEPCDVCVIDACTVINSQGRREKHPYGHISMCLGNGVWASDYIQNSMCGLNGTPPQNAVHVYRYRNRVQ